MHLRRSILALVLLVPGVAAHPDDPHHDVCDPTLDTFCWYCSYAHEERGWREDRLCHVDGSGFVYRFCTLMVLEHCQV